MFLISGRKYFYFYLSLLNVLLFTHLVYMYFLSQIGMSHYRVQKPHGEYKIQVFQNLSKDKMEVQLQNFRFLLFTGGLAGSLFCTFNVDSDRLTVCKLNKSTHSNIRCSFLNASYNRTMITLN